jgi:hypothetical protein
MRKVLIGINIRNLFSIKMGSLRQPIDKKSISRRVVTSADRWDELHRFLHFIPAINGACEV